ncbi:hypothetical protein GAP32_074 [Cronobacter phage vB_CsaM_GAP32]|uniref:Uncharacterized protein n=1 Tax=Cronobacter phage vB_CsaM_GAP32 TaxID=1141136 RepID=K4F771_9CAUD|nr:hypothetical protein GAP32_074 [Cronobacter phage vB_CsaM_GAP32]AFC21522.1 hypothetical protein GAP32_074 [Cronobacter phage vB_CsaM_GAP32]
MEKTEYSKLRTKVLGIIEGLTLLDPKYFNVRRVITYAEQIHSNQRRDGNPEFSHQLEMLSLALGLHNSLLDPYSVYMAIVTHDLIEDYPEYQQELAQMFPDSVKYSRTLSKFVDSDSSEGKTYYDYFEQIAHCAVCSVVKLIDRIHNLSTAVGVFSIAKLAEYCDEVEKYFLDMMRTAKNQFNQREVYEVLKFMLQTEVRTIRAFLTILESKGS